MSMVGRSLAMSITLLALASTVKCGVLFASLNRTLVVTAQIQSSTPAVAKAGTDRIAVQWSLNSTFAGVDANYAMVNIKLCYAPPSQVGRSWRGTKPDLSLDKTCAAAVISSQKYTAAGNSTVWTVAKSVPKAFYFVRAYAVNAMGTQLAFGQTTNMYKTTNIFAVDPISGRHASMDVAAALFSAFAVGSLVSFLGIEALLAKRKASKL